MPLTHSRVRERYNDLCGEERVQNKKKQSINQIEIYLLRSIVSQRAQT